MPLHRWLRLSACGALIVNRLSLTRALPVLVAVSAGCLLVGPAAGRGAWRITVKAMPLVRSTRNEVNHMTNVGIDAGLIGGYYAQRWFIATETGIDWAAATYIKHSERYRETSYEGAKDGWYSTIWDIVLRAGQMRDYQFRLPFVPVYLVVGLNIHLPAAP